MTATTTRNGATALMPALGPDVTNDAENDIAGRRPYIARIVVEGVAPLLFHAWSCEAVESKGRAAKGSTEKKTDNVESYIYRCEDGTIGLPGEYIRGAIVNKQNGAAKYRQDPRSPRKSALDLYKAGVVSMTPIATLGKTTWDYLDQRRVTVQLSGITRTRPAFLTGWRAEFDLQVLLPEYIKPQDLLSVLTDAGRLVGVGDFRPTYGRFNVCSFSVVED